MTYEDMVSRRLENLLRHIKHVRENCELLGHRLIANKQEVVGRPLIANGQIHDFSKFSGIEWDYLADSTKPSELASTFEVCFEAALRQHVSTNPHHPEYWGSIKEMPPVYLAEMVCDWAARGAEQGSELREWVKDKATKKYKFSCRSRVYRDIKGFIDLLLERGFS